MIRGDTGLCWVEICRVIIDNDDGENMKHTRVLRGALVTMVSAGCLLAAIPANAAETQQNPLELYSSLGFFKDNDAKTGYEDETVYEYMKKYLSDSKTKLGDPQDATNLDQMLKALDVIDQGNAIRKSLGLPEFEVNDYLMAAAQLAANKGEIPAYYGDDDFSGPFVLQTIAKSYKNPYDGWYTEEKKYVDAGTCAAHDNCDSYYIFTDEGVTVTGMGYAYRSVKPYSPPTIVQDYGDWLEPTPSYTVADYRQRVKDYQAKYVLGKDVLAVRRGNVYYLNKSTHGGKADKVVAFGKPSDQVVVGDWDGDGVDTLAVRRGNRYYLNNSIHGGKADKVVAFGKPSDQVVVGDWDGDGKDTLAVRRGNNYYLLNSIHSGKADKIVAYGKASDQVLVGDWKGSGVDSLAVRRGNTYYLSYTIHGGKADKAVAFGKAADQVLVGDWAGVGLDSLAVRRGNTYYLSYTIHGGMADRQVAFGKATDQVLAGLWFK